MKLVIVFVGCFNVGKFMLFNWFMCLCDVLVVDLLGLMCDCYYGEGCVGEWFYLVVDMGGFEFVVKDGILYEMVC